ncbi:hypothetical protein D3C73_1267060 [compost metagenome]
MRGSILWMRSSAIWNRCSPSNAVPAWAATSIELRTLPLSGSRALILLLHANQTFSPSQVTPHTWSTSANGPYSRMISAVACFIWHSSMGLVPFILATGQRRRE